MTKKLRVVMRKAPKNKAQNLTDRDVAAAMVVMQRGLAAVGHTVSQP